MTHTCCIHELASWYTAARIPRLPTVQLQHRHLPLRQYPCTATWSRQDIRIGTLSVQHGTVSHAHLRQTYVYMWRRMHGNSRTRRDEAGTAQESTSVCTYVSGCVGHVWRAEWSCMSACIRLHQCNRCVTAACLLTPPTPSPPPTIRSPPFPPPLLPARLPAPALHASAIDHQFLMMTGPSGGGCRVSELLRVVSV